VFIIFFFHGVMSWAKDYDLGEYIYRDGKLGPAETITCVPCPGNSHAFAVQNASVTPLVSKTCFKNASECSTAISNAGLGIFCLPMNSTDKPVHFAIYNANNFPDQTTSYAPETFDNIEDCNAKIVSYGDGPGLKLKGKPKPKANADNYVDLSEPGGSMEHVSARDQDDFSDCFAVAAAELTDAWRFSHGEGAPWKQSAAILVEGPAMVLQRKDEYNGTGGEIDDAIRVFRKNGGSCDKDAVLDAVPNPNAINTLRQLMNLNKEYQSDWKAQESIDAFTSTYSSELKDIYSHSCTVSGAPALPGVTDLYKILDTQYGNEVSAVLNAVCQDPKVKISFQLPRPISLSMTNFSDSQITDMIAYELKDKTSLPVAIALCSKVFHDTSYRGGHDDTNVPDDCGDHAALVIGKKGIGRNLEFLVRNSWGADCGTVNLPCDNKGSFWISAADLSANINQIHQFPDDK
jgi:hypothetical protein